MRLLTGVFTAGLCLATERTLPSADHIKQLQQAHQREHARSMRTISHERQRLAMNKPEPRLSEEDRAQLKAAIERFARERAGGR